MSNLDVLGECVIVSSLDFLGIEYILGLMLEVNVNCAGVLGVLVAVADVVLI